jgi:hypothetical protein
MNRIVARFRLIFLAPVLAFIALLAWGLASPMGASPDDDFHLVSTWCASASPAANCEEGTESTNRRVPAVLLDSACYLPESSESAGCQATQVSFDPTVTELTERGNFNPSYPPLYYAVMGLFVGSDILASVLLMRVVTAVLFVALTTAIFMLLPVHRRQTLMWSWLVTTVPLGLFLIPSNNPSSWAIIGVGSAWIALLGWFESAGRQKIGLGIAFGVSALMAAGARGDSAAYVSLGIVAVLVLTFARKRAYFINAILPLVFVGISVLFLLSARQIRVASDGFTGGIPSAVGEARDPLSLLAFNILNIPSLWAGVFGSWGLGWLEVDMPDLVSFGSLACFVLVAGIGFGKLTNRKAIVVAAVASVLVVLPVFVLTRGGDAVGQQVQPRYILPLIVLLAGLLLLRAGERSVVFSRGQIILVSLTLTVVQFIALHTTMRRYITGTDDQGFNLNSGIEWWWSIPVSPMAVFIAGSLSYAGLVAILAREAIRNTRVVASTPERADVVSP